VGESHEQIRKYICLTELIPPILKLVDNTVLKDKEVLQIAMRPAVELAYLPKEGLQILYDTMQLEDCTPSHAQAIKMRRFLEEGRLNEDVILCNWEGWHHEGEKPESGNLHCDRTYREPLWAAGRAEGKGYRRRTYKGRVF